MLPTKGLVTAWVVSSPVYWRWRADSLPLFLSGLTWTGSGDCWTCLGNSETPCVMVKYPEICLLSLFAEFELYDKTHSSRAPLLESNNGCTKNWNQHITYQTKTWPTAKSHWDLMVPAPKDGPSKGHPQKKTMIDMCQVSCKCWCKPSCLRTWSRRETQQSKPMGFDRLVLFCLKIRCTKNQWMIVFFHIKWLVGGKSPIHSHCISIYNCHDKLFRYISLYSQWLPLNANVE